MSINVMAKKWLNTKEYKDWAKAVKTRDNYTCIVCGRTEGIIAAHHLIPKNFKRYRTELDNGVSLCVQHHIFGKFSAHKNPFWFEMFMKEHRPITLLQTKIKIQDLIDENDL
jgi:hypothetical protein